MKLFSLVALFGLLALAPAKAHEGPHVFMQVNGNEYSKETLEVPLNSRVTFFIVPQRVQQCDFRGGNRRWSRLESGHWDARAFSFTINHRRTVTYRICCEDTKGQTVCARAKIRGVP